MNSSTSIIRDKEVRDAYHELRRAELVQNYKNNPAEQKPLKVKRYHVTGGYIHEKYLKQTVILPKLLEPEGDGDCEQKEALHQSLDIITNQNLTHDTTILLHTNGKGVDSLLKMGLLRPQALTAQAIKALGAYRKVNCKRAVKSRIQSRLKDLKEQLLSSAQERIEHLQDLELHLGHRIYQDTVEKCAEQMLKDLNTYIAKQTLSTDDILLANEIEQWKNLYHHTRAGSLELAYQENAKEAKELQELIRAHQKDAEWLQTTGNEKIQLFIKERIVATTRQMQGMNQVLTHVHGSGVYDRGDLNSCAEDAIKLTRDHCQDFHTPMTLKHQLRFAPKQNVTIDSDVHTNGSLGELEEFMLGVSVVCGDNSPLDAFRGKVIETSAVKWRHWRSFYDFGKPYTFSIFSSWKRFAAWGWDWILSPFNLVETAIRGHDANFFQEVRKKIFSYFKLALNDHAELGDNTDYYALIARLNRNTSVSTKIGLEVYKVFNYLFVQGLWKGLNDGWKQIKRLPENLRGDFQKPERNLGEFLKEFKQEVEAIEDSDRRLLGCDLVLATITVGKGEDLDQLLQEKRHTLSQQYPGLPQLIKHGDDYYLWSYHEGKWEKALIDGHVGTAFRRLPFSKIKAEKGSKLLKKGSYYLTRHINHILNSAYHQTHFEAPSAHEMPLLLEGMQKDCVPEEKKPDKRVLYAQPEFSLNPYESRGVLNSSVSGYIEFIDLFGHNMFAKHPFTTSVSLLATAMSFMAFFTPELTAKLFTQGYVDFARWLGYIWTNDVLSASTAGSFTIFKLVGAAMEGLEHGPDSWISRAFSHLINDPAKTVTYISLAWFIGHVLVYWLDVPGLSKELRSHIGNPPEPSEMFGGLKVAICFYQLFANPHSDQEEARQNFIEQCMENYLESKKRRGVQVTNEEEEEIRRSLEDTLTPEKIADVRGTLHETDEAPKSKVDQELNFLLYLGMHKDKLARLSPELKSKLQYQVQQCVNSSEDATAIDKYIDPERYAPKSTLRSFLGRLISYGPTTVRCVLSPLAGCCARSWYSFFRPWKELGSMLRDDFVSTTFAFLRFGNKTAESLFNRLPRTLADVFVNGIFARTLSFFGYHDLALKSYHLSAKADQFQSEMYATTTGGIMAYLARKNSVPPPEVSLLYVANEKMREKFPEPPGQERTSQPGTPRSLAAAITLPGTSPRSTTNEYEKTLHSDEVVVSDIGCTA